MGNWTRFWVWALAALGIDQFFKLGVVSWIGLRTLGQVEVFPPYLVFRLGWNRGVNFGLLPADSDFARWMLIGVSIAICGLVMWWIRNETRALAWISAGFLVGGALGNVVDRLLYGAVLDFLNVSCCGVQNPYVFNTADIAIFAGAIGLILFTGEKNDA